jgi:hypothetical protein
MDIFAGQPCLSCIDIPIRCNWNHHSYELLGVLLARLGILGRRWTDYQKVQGSNLCTPLHDIWRFILFPSKS